MLGWRVVLWAAIVVAALWFLYAVRAILLPFVLSYLICAILQPLIKFLKERGMPQRRAVLMAYLGFFGSMTMLIVGISPVLGGQIANVQANVRGLVSQFAKSNENENLFRRWNPVSVAERTKNKDFIDQMFESNYEVLHRNQLPTSKEVFIQEYVNPHKDEIDQRLKGFFGSTIGFAGDLISKLFLLLLVPLVTFAMLSDMDNFKERSAMWIPPSIRKTTLEVLGDIGGVFMGYLRGVTFAIAAYMVLMGLVLTLVGVPYGLILGVVVGLVYLIPILNYPISAAIIVVVTGLAGSPNLLGMALPSPWIHGVVALAIFSLFHFGFDMGVYPRMVGQSVGLHPAVSFFVTLSGGALFGLVGMLFAFPFAGSVKVILDRLLEITSKGAEQLNLPSVPLRHRGG